MTEEDEEFNRIERESRIKQDYVRDIKKPSREALMAEVAVLIELVHVLSDKVAELEAKQEQGKSFFKFRECEDSQAGTATPPQRTWVGLTNEEREELMDNYDVASPDYAKAIEAKLREKNSTHKEKNT